MKRYDIDKRQRSLTKLWLTLLTVALVGLIISSMAVYRTYNKGLQPVSASQRAVSVTIPQGATVREIGKKLQDQGLIKSSWAFERYIYNHNLRNRLQAGTYSLRPNQGVKEIVIVLTQGKVATDLVTILPGQRLDQIRNSLINNGGFSAEAVDAALDPTLYADHPALADKPTGANLEGYLYPDSFQKTANTKPETIIRASLDEMQKHLTPEVRAAFVKQNLNVHEGVVLASIIEQEVGNPADKPTVAQVFLRRLRENMQLGSDVTAFYGALKAEQEASVTYDSPYNTRLHPGLPPGPISNVSDSSLAAVAQPGTGDYLFFVAGDDGKTYFSHTLEEHEALTKAHCKTLCN
ncbi:MAG TPA: endolytic transglycosylase MltG [Candidatus Limnocylindrales bacterium]|nr:endolytic transglycosylase MltG [Candidatus Limnocylindrales bacterium]